MYSWSLHDESSLSCPCRHTEFGAPSLSSCQPVCHHSPPIAPIQIEASSKKGSEEVRIRLVDTVPAKLNLAPENKETPMSGSLCFVPDLFLMAFPFPLGHGLTVVVPHTRLESDRPLLRHTFPSLNRVYWVAQRCQWAPGCEMVEEQAISLTHSLFPSCEGMQTLHDVQCREDQYEGSWILPPSCDGDCADSVEVSRTVTFFASYDASGDRMVWLLACVPTPCLESLSPVCNSFISIVCPTPILFKFSQ